MWDIRLDGTANVCPSVAQTGSPAPNDQPCVSLRGAAMRLDGPNLT
jgi:hypothetical protein